MKVFIFGAGYSARAFARRYEGEIYGTTRSLERFKILKQAGIFPLLFNGIDVDNAVISQLQESELVIISAAPDDNGDPILRQPKLLNAMENVKWIGYLSTIGVYGDHQGRWIDEQTPCVPGQPRNAERLNVENAWQKFGDQKHIATAILRLSGIYGPGRNAFLKLQHHEAVSVVKPGQVFNRICSADIANALFFLSSMGSAGIFNITDDLPAPGEAVIEYAAQLMGVTPPPKVSFDDANLSPMARSFYSENKRVSNARLKALGYKFLYPNYEVALKTMWQNNVWREEQ